MKAVVARNGRVSVERVARVEWGARVGAEADAGAGAGVGVGAGAGAGADAGSAIPRGHVLVQTEYSAVSPGTELSVIRLSGEQPSGLGYSAVGIVRQVGPGVESLEAGQRVACYGAPYVRHAEWLCVPANLTAVVPDGVRSEEAAFAGLGAIAIHALRTADLRFGETAVVVGLGILGNIIAQIANAAAYRTIGVDINAERVTRIRELGLAEMYSEPGDVGRRLFSASASAGGAGGASAGAGSAGTGADAVLLCASGAGESLINQALRWIRDRGKIVIVGDLSMTFSREQMFMKEAQLLISRAGGPGRYDVNYERHNVDYPLGYVRWTEGRNVAEFIRLLAEKRIAIGPLISEIYPIDEAAQAYAGYAQRPDMLGTLLRY